MARTVKVNVDKNVEALAGESKFQDVLPDSTLLFRFAPPVEGSDGVIFYPSFNHYKLKEDDRKIALADLSVHGDSTTGTEDYIAELSAYLKENNNPNTPLHGIGKDIQGNIRYYLQGWPVRREDDGSYTYGKLKLIAFSKTASKSLQAVSKKTEAMGEEHFSDEVGGQLILIERTGSGFETKYSFERAGQLKPLDDVIQGWRDQLLEDVTEALMLNVLPRDRQRQIAEATFPNLDWETIDQEVPV